MFPRFALREEENQLPTRVSIIGRFRWTAVSSQNVYK